MVKFAYKVLEIFDDEAPEPFGTEVLDHKPVVGEVIQLHWLDGREAYKVKVCSVDSFFRLQVVKWVSGASTG